MEPEDKLRRSGVGLARLSIIIPVYNGAKTIGPLVSRLHEELARRYELEVVLVNDCSPRDDSEKVCRQLCRKYRGSVSFVNLSKNFGEHNAVMAGLRYCTGDAAVIMDDDFQNPPGEVIKLVEKLSEGYDVVYSCYEKKQHHWFRNLGSRFNNFVASVMLGKPKGLYLSSFKVINRFLVGEVSRYDGPYPYIDGLILRVTRKYATVLVGHDPREEGRSGYNLHKLISLWLNMFTNFSILPLRVASIGGVLFALLGFAFALFVIVEKLADPTIPVGWTSTVCIILVVAGVQLIALGMIGEYLGRLFLKDNGSPQYVVREFIPIERESFDEKRGE
ncbi:MAG TPA: glycosyltransferase [Gammaproteobacteria bacterium]|nr:glycosyltransferase [Gammaproteobacteria bacterium]